MKLIITHSHKQKHGVKVSSYSFSELLQGDKDKKLEDYIEFTLLMTLLIDNEEEELIKKYSGERYLRNFKLDELKNGYSKSLQDSQGLEKLIKLELEVIEYIRLLKEYLSTAVAYVDETEYSF